MKVIIKSSV